MPDPNLSSFIWSVADLLRGDYKQSDYGKVILPFTVLRRLDCVLEPTKAAVLAELAKRTQAKINPEPFLLRKSGQLFYNTSPLDLKKLMGDQDHIGENLRAYEIPFNRHFYVFKPPRPLAEIDAELKGVTDRILTMIGGLTK
jgi:type I restriction enzyme M protein